MTTQFPDTCTIGDRQWAIDECEGSLECIPTSESLGFKTTTQSTANWSGRIDHFLVHRNRLFLLKIEAHLVDSYAGDMPPRARLEEVIRHDGPFLRRQTLFVYDDLTIPFTGAMCISRPYEDGWNIPQSAPDDLLVSEERRTLIFVRGFLASVITDWPQIDLKPTLKKAEDALRRELLSLMPNDGIVLTLWDWDIRFEKSFEDLFELAFTADDDYIHQETTGLFENFLGWIDEMGMDFAQDRYSADAFREWIQDACQDFVRNWRKNVAEAFHKKVASL